MSEILTRATRIRSSLGSDAADRFTMEHLGSVFNVAKKRLRNQVRPATTPTPPSVPTGAVPNLVAEAPPSPPLGQSLMSFMNKQAEFRPRLCWTCSKGTDPEDTDESHYGRCACAEKKASLATRLRRAFNVTHTHPTPAQAASGNYRKGRVNFRGLLIAIENPPGSTRRGVDDKGNEWESVLTCAYGYFTGTGHVKEALWSGRDVGVSSLASDEDAVRTSDSPAVQGLRWSRDTSLRKVASLREFLGGHGAASVGEITGPQGERSGLLARELPLGDQGGAGDQQALDALGGCGREKSAFNRLGQAGWVESRNGLRPDRRRVELAGRRGEDGQTGAERATRSGSLLLHGGDALADGLGSEAGRIQGAVVKAARSRLDVQAGGGNAEQEESRVYSSSSPDFLQRKDAVSDRVGARAGDTLRHSEAEVSPGMASGGGVHYSLEKAARIPIAADGDAVDVFIGPDIDSDLVVVVDQYKGGVFDESKFCIGVTTRQQGERLYLSNYPRSWKLGPVSTTTVQQLKTWLAEGDTKAPFKGQLVKAAVVKQDAETGKWVLWTKDETRKLGTHDSPDEAYKQEYAIQQSQARLEPKRGTADSFHKKLKAALGQTEKAAALRPDKWERLCVRRGQCPTCGQSNCEGKVCGCGKTLSNDEWKALRDKADAGVDLRTKEAGVLQRLAPYRTAFKEVMLGSKLPPMEVALKDVPKDAADLTQLLPRLHSLLKVTFSKSAAQPDQDTALRKDWILGGTAAAAAGGKLQFDLAGQRAKARDWEAAMHWQSRGLEDSKLHALDTDQLLNRAQDLTDDYIRGGQRTAQSKILGVTAGQVPKLHVWKDYFHRVLADKGPGRWEVAAKDRDARLNHYSMFSDRRVTPEAIRGHMVEKAINSLDSGVLEKLDPAVRQILTHGDAHMKDRLAAIAKIPGADVGGITKLLTTALRGTGDAAHGPARFGELVRLAGQRGQALNTGQIYRLASGGAVKGLRGVGSATALLGGGMLAATGFSALKDRLHKSAAATFDRAADNMSEGQRTSLAAILAGASPMSAMSGFNELRRKDLNRIGVTYGEQNYQHAEIGGGHKEPAVSLAELLEDENHRRGGKYEIARYARNRDGMLGKVEGLRSVEERLAGVKDTSRINTFERALRGDPGVNVMVNTGFGDYIPKASQKDLRFSAEGALQNHAINGRIPTRSLVNYLTDGVPYDSTAYSATAGDRNANGRTLFQSWGGGAREAHGDMKNMGVKGRINTLANVTGVNRLRHALGMSSSHTGVQHMGSDVPFALSEGKMDMIRKVRSEADALKSLQKYIADPNADPAMARQLQEVIDAKQSGKKVVAFSGASRGDYVTTRAAELHDALQAKGRGDVHIVAQLANAINDPKQMKMLEGRGGISQFGRMPPEQFLALQNYANLHGNSTGTSSWVEALLGRGNSFQPKNWGFSLKWPDHTPMFLDDDPLRKGQLGGRESIAKRTQNRLQSLFPGLDPHHGQAGIQDWNLNHLQEQARAGRMTADSADDVLGLLDRDASNPHMAEAYERQIQGAQKKFVGSIFNEARRNKVMSRLKGGGKLLAPLAMLPAAYGLLSHENKPTGGPGIPVKPTVAPPAPSALPSWLQGDNGRNLAIGGGAVAAGSLLAYLMARRHKKKRLQEA